MTEQTITDQDHRYLNPKAPYSPPEERKVELFAKIKRTSKYYYQGPDEHKKHRAFRIDAIQECDTHHIRMNNNNYRCRDLSFWVKSVEGDLIPLAGGTKQ
jgi:hypothetical protein